MNVLIAGASGLIGVTLTEHLRERGDRIVQLVRRPPRPREGVAEVHWDAVHASSVDLDAVGQIDAVFNFAGASVVHRWSSAYKREIASTRINATIGLVDLMSSMAVRPKVSVTASGINYYGHRGDEVLTEDSPPGRGFLAATAIAWQQAGERANDLGVRTVFPRFGTLLGRGRGPLEFLTLPYRRYGIGGQLGNGRQWAPWMHIQDTVRALALMADDDQFRGGVNFVSPGVVRNREMMTAIGVALGRPSFGWMPAVVARLIYGEMIQEIAVESILAVPKKLQDAGFEFHFSDLTDALRDLLGEPGAAAGENTGAGAAA